MRLREVELQRLSIPFKGSFGHAASMRSATEPVLVTLHDEQGRRGVGEALPRDYVTGETLQTVIERDGPALARELLASALPTMDAVVAWLREAVSRWDHALSAFGAFELALLDLAGQRHGVALVDLLGGVQSPELPAGMVIGFEVATAKLERHCAALRFGKRRHIKVKIGAADDAQRLAIIARVLGPLPLRLDANAAWTADEAVARLGALAAVPGLAIASVEQPVGKHDLAGLRRIRTELGLRVMADESVCSFADAERLVAAQAVDVFNVRLGKMGGALATARICEFARRAGIGASLGTMVGETGVLGRASELLGRALAPTAGFDCLDGKGQNAFLLTEDILEPDADADVHAPGLGVRVSDDRVRAHAVEHHSFRD
ncbi:MAG: hypothetical protein K1X88_23790 [Nannocystaceae bacterium]|nr:hypothetical protein [Nannocystaceae bacterium]